MWIARGRSSYIAAVCVHSGIKFEPPERRRRRSLPACESASTKREARSRRMLLLAANCGDKRIFTYLYLCRLLQLFGLREGKAALYGAKHGLPKRKQNERTLSLAVWLSGLIVASNFFGRTKERKSARGVSYPLLILLNMYVCVWTTVAAAAFCSWDCRWFLYCCCCWCCCRIQAYEL